jgi:rod shape-determining protein MreD
MNLTWRALVRTGILIVLCVVLQISGFADMRILGGNIDLIPLVVGAISLYAGAIPGAIAGFCTGLLVDLLIGQHLGATALVLTAVGYWVGRFGEIRDRSHGLLPIPVAAASTFGYEVALALVSFMLNIGAAVSLLVVRDAIITVLLNVAVALPFFALSRKVLRPILTVDPYIPRRRRAEPRATGPIGLRGLEV